MPDSIGYSSRLCHYWNPRFPLGLLAILLAIVGTVNDPSGVRVIGCGKKIKSLPACVRVCWRLLCERVRLGLAAHSSLSGARHAKKSSSKEMPLLQTVVHPESQNCLPPKILFPIALPKGEQSGQSEALARPASQSRPLARARGSGACA